ncbi:MAG: NAD(P)-dependent alcohol dehydrogenase [Acidobacteria bacterium]|nr:NAD(P)-dependent alcohol dehydrogenase [Acidobacteriota bacterium]
MKALVQDSYVSAKGVVHVEDVEMPLVGDAEVLVRVRAASAKMYGWDLPAIVQSVGRMIARFRKPKVRVPGLDFAGDVEAVGNDVIRFRPGAAVFGLSKGALAEYVSVTEDALAVKPTIVSFAEAATIAVAGPTALHALRKGQVESGHHVLVVGASGGVGTFAVQLAKAFGADVTGVCSTKNLELVLSLGADHAIDYTREDFTRGGPRYDVILDMAGSHSLSDLRRALRPDGTLVMVGQSGIPTSDQTWFKSLSRWLRAAVWSRFIGQRLVALIQPKAEGALDTLKDFIEAGQLTPIVTATHPLSEAPEAIKRFEQGHGQGRMVIEFLPSDT